MTHESGVGSTGTKNCRYCGLGIPQAASLCHHCKKYQGRALNFVTSIAAVSAFFTLLVGLLTYVVGRIPELVQARLRHQLAVVDFLHAEHGNTRLVAQNAGLSDVYVQRFTIYLPSRDDPHRSSAKSVNRVIEAGEMMVHEVDAKATPYSYGYPYIDGAPEGWRLPDQSLRDLLEEDDCFHLVHAGPSIGSLANIVSFVEREEGQTLLRADHEVWVRYYSGDRKSWREVQIDGIAVLARKKAPECEGRLGSLPVEGMVVD